MTVLINLLEKNKQKGVKFINILNKLKILEVGIEINKQKLILIIDSAAEFGIFLSGSYSYNPDNLSNWT